MRIADIKLNDIVDTEKGIAVSVWFQGCPFRCPKCHNPQTWDFDGGYEIDEDEMIENVLSHLHDNNVKRNLSLLGGEPLCFDNRPIAADLIRAVKHNYPETKIMIWTGYDFEELTETMDFDLLCILNDTDTLITGRYEDDKRDITLHLRGSRNQKIFDKTELGWKERNG